jgi:hypothetical protein
MKIVTNVFLAILDDGMNGTGRVGGGRRATALLLLLLLPIPSNNKS